METIRRFKYDYFEAFEGLNDLPRDRDPPPVLGKLTKLGKIHSD